MSHMSFGWSVPAGVIWRTCDMINIPLADEFLVSWSCILCPIVTDYHIRPTKDGTIVFGHFSHCTGGWYTLEFSYKWVFAEPVNDQEVWFVTYWENVWRYGLPRSRRCGIGEQRCLALLFLVFLAHLTRLAHPFNLLVEINPVNRVACPALGFADPLVASVLLLQDVCLHTGWDEDLSSIADDTRFCARLIAECPVWQWVHRQFFDGCWPSGMNHLLQFLQNWVAGVSPRSCCCFLEAKLMRQISIWSTRRSSGISSLFSGFGMWLRASASSMLRPGRYSIQ